MPKKTSMDAVVVGAGPNGLSAAIRLALEGYSVAVFEMANTVGGGTRTKELIREGYRHDICSAVHPLGISSPFLRRLPLQDHGLAWIHPDIPLAHPLDDAPPAVLFRELDKTVEALGEDGEIWKKMVRQISDAWPVFTGDILSPLRIPENPFLLSSFGLTAIQSARLTSLRFRTPAARALFGGLAAHSMLDLDRSLTSAIAIVLGAAAHASGWPIAKGGSQSITNAMSGYLEKLGGVIHTGTPIRSLKDLPESKVVLFDLTPKQILSIAAPEISRTYRRRLQRFRYGQGVFKIDYILKEPVPWKDAACGRAGTVHLGGTFNEIARSEKEMSSGKPPEKPYVLVAQQSKFDSSRQPPDGGQTLWAYCHVPSNSEVNMTDAIENQIERFAPGFKDVIDERFTMTARDFERYNPNYIGGDINGGVQDLGQQFSRPVSMFSPYVIPGSGRLFICSSSSPPGGGVHGMCGFHAAEAVLRRAFHLPKREWRFEL